MMQSDRGSAKNVAGWQEDCLRKPPVLMVLNIQSRRWRTAHISCVYSPMRVFLSLVVHSCFILFFVFLRDYEPLWFAQILLLNVSFVSSKEIF